MALTHPTYLATVLLEKNRWQAGKVPTFRVSDWGRRFREAGFDGVELWENHAALATEGELSALADMPCPVRIFNSYCSFDDAGVADRKRAAVLATRFATQGVKFNLGHDEEAIPTYQRNLESWRHELPKGCRLLCECHGGTVLEEPARAKAILEPLAGDLEIIVHAFAGDDDSLEEWLATFGAAVTHVHAAASGGDGQLARLADVEDLVHGRIRRLLEAGFAGTLSVEFTQGVARDPEGQDELFANATDDLQVLREALAR